MVESRLVINVGPLKGLRSFCQYTAEKLKLYSRLCKEGRIPEVEWDLSNVRSPHMSMAGLTAFLTVAHRLRQFTGHAPRASVRWDPAVFTFWHDISFLKVVRDYDLIRWPDNIIGGYNPGKGNPNTEIVVFGGAVPVGELDDQELEDIKEELRPIVREDLLLRCHPLFESRRSGTKFDLTVIDQITDTTSELIVNSVIHGRAPAFVGLQRSPSGITVAVCDCGNGFYKSLSRRVKRLTGHRVRNNVDAVILGSLINKDSMGLWRAIDIITGYNGYVVICSGDGEIRWNLPLWREVSSLEAANVEDIREIVGKLTKGPLSRDKYSSGYCRQLKCGLRGARISFEIKFRK